MKHFFLSRTAPVVISFLMLCHLPIDASASHANSFPSILSFKKIKTSLWVTRSLSQTINFPAFPSKSYGDSNFSPEATASSGLALTYISSNTSVATIVDGQIHIVGVGSTNITASQSGNATYAPAADVVRALTVNKAYQTVTLPSIPLKIYGNEDFA